ncbi:hypothetical protein BTA51_11995 [Hahella sp. CCB-MM4]|uniref:DUF4136 domain-containing protein n=1 Tax=Hahella sp. (strain CCB-MM4) TaxID=1926491 RepID=UPI000B9A2824|nr:DUF4136 domain-containing protein [Hahella sp. CCB-MM4]OZG73199.1 hypothetical protein BTA51_11995 [Hahella sp. CCB-MM4]
MKVIAGCCLTIFMILGGCAGPKVLVDYQPGTSFQGLDRYAINLNDDTTSSMSLTDERVKNAVMLFMRNKGYTLVEPTEAEIITSWHIKKDKEIRREGFSYGIGYGIASGHTGVGISMQTRPPATEVIRGRLVLEMIDPATSRVIWSAESTEQLSEDETPSAREAEIRRIVGEMLKEFPQAS